MQPRTASFLGFKLGIAFLAGIVALILLPAQAVLADTYFVDMTADDAGATDCIDNVLGDCSLRGAVTKANLHAGPDRIVLPDRTFTLTRLGVEDDNKDGDLDIQAGGGNLRIEGEGAGVTIINGRASQGLVPGVDRVLHIDPDGSGSILVEIVGVSIQYGYAETYAGGIYIDGNGTVSVTNSAIMSNTVTLASTSGGGGGIFNDHATLFLRNTDVMSNTARGVTVGREVAGGGILLESTAVMTLTNSTVAWNEVTTIPGTGSSARGGGLANLHGAANIHASTFWGNQASGGSSGSIGTGGGIANDSSGRLTLDEESVLLDNWADLYGGGIANTESILVIDNSSLSLNASGSSGGGIYNYLSTAILTDTTITLNMAEGTGGGLNGMEDEMSLTRCMVSGNKAWGGNGGGIYDALGTVHLVDSTLFANRTSKSGGGLHAHGGTVYITRSTLMDNIAEEPSAGPPTSNHGGGLSLRIATAHVVNSTLSGNRAEESGGGAYSDESLTSLSHTTVANNVADEDDDGHGDGGGVFGTGVGTLAIVNTILGGNLDRGGQAPECGGITLSGHGDNIIKDRTGCSISGSGTNWALDPMLDTLGDNGGPTETHALRPGSPAIDRVSNNCRTFSNEILAIDQRGVTRPKGPACDIGSYEAEPPRIYLPLVLRSAQP
jgi:hypothetical protein